MLSGNVSVVQVQRTRGHGRLADLDEVTAVAGSCSVLRLSRRLLILLMLKVAIFTELPLFVHPIPQFVAQC
jgi:hypothetical protein